MSRLKTVCLLTVVLVLMATLNARAQTADLAARLPVDTQIYLYWRGVRSLKPGSENALVSLWNDPGFRPMRQWIVQGLLDATARNPRLPQIPRKDIEGLLADPFVFGIRLATQASSDHAGSAADGFLVVQMEGKTGRELRADLERYPEAMANVRFTRSGLLLASSDPATVRELARQFGSASLTESKSLSTLTSFREARAEIAGQPPVEFFMRVPQTSQLAPRKTPGFNTRIFLQSVHLERVHLLCGSIDLNEPTAFLHFAILGDTARGSLFDLFGANVPSFRALAAAPQGASINVAQFDLAAALSLLTNAVSAAMEPDQGARLELFSGLLSSAVVPALGGEYAMIWPRLTGTDSTSLLAWTVNPQPANRLFSTTLAPFLKPVGEEGEIRYFRPAGRSAGAANGGAPGESSDAGGRPAAARPSVLLALIPGMVLMGKDEVLLRHTARAVTAAAPSPGLAADMRFRAARAELPAELSEMSYFDLQTFEWKEWIRQMAAGMARKDPRAAERAAELEKWGDEGGDAVLARHFHMVVAGAWKNDRGMHWLGDIH